MNNLRKIIYIICGIILIAFSLMIFLGSFKDGKDYVEGNLIVYYFPALIGISLLLFGFSFFKENIFSKICLAIVFIFICMLGLFMLFSSDSAENMGAIGILIIFLPIITILITIGNLKAVHEKIPYNKYVKSIIGLLIIAGLYFALVAFFMIIMTLIF